MSAQIDSSPVAAEPRRWQRLRVVPVSFAQACAFVDAFHRHHARPQGHKFSIGVLDETGTHVGVVIIGRPVARNFDDGWTLEVTRLTTDGSTNACSALYGAAWRTARAQGYRRLITYTQTTESGASLRAAGFLQAATRAARPGWDVPTRPRQRTGTEQTTRHLWELTTTDAPELPSWRDETSDETPVAGPAADKHRCESCQAPTVAAPTGRPRRYCCPACRQAAYRRRQQLI